MTAILASQTIHNMQEIESLGRKHKVIPQAIKEVVEALLAERVLCMEKVGTQNIYWAFPSSQKAMLLSQLDTIKAEVNDARIKLAAAVTKKNECLSAVTMSAEARSAIIANSRSTQKALDAARAKLLSLKKNDPAAVAKKLQELKMAQKTCDMWTENAFILRQRLVEKFGCSEEQVESQFGISRDLDYVGNIE